MRNKQRHLEAGALTRGIRTEWERTDRDSVVVLGEKACLTERGCKGKKNWAQSKEGHGECATGLRHVESQWPREETAQHLQMPLMRILGGREYSWRSGLHQKSPFPQSPSQAAWCFNNDPVEASSYLWGQAVPGMKVMSWEWGRKPGIKQDGTTSTVFHIDLVLTPEDRWQGGSSWCVRRWDGAEAGRRKKILLFLVW